jgi:glycosyltransferase involved in cell wall biosynthesis
MTLFKQANAALRDKRFEPAIALYIRSLQATPALAQFLLPNLNAAQTSYRKARGASQQPIVIVAGWNLAQNAAGRVITLAQLYQPLAKVEIIGCFFPKWGYEVWQPIRSQPIPIHGIAIKDESQFIQQATELVLKHPCDVLHLCKPRAPNILIGLLYKLIWNARVLVDIDDEELAFVSATAPIDLREYLTAHTSLPELRDLTGETWTRIAVGLVNAFDGITVANPVLQQRYGGTIVRHARDEKLFVPSAARRQQNRAKLNIPESEKVVLFLGTPRQAKGLLDTAKAVASLNRPDVRLVIVGDFPKEAQILKAEIQALPKLNAQFLGDQAFDSVPDIVSVGDFCILLQDPDSLAAQFQTPAKLSDALAMGLTVLAEKTPGLADLAEQGALRPVTRTTLGAELAKALSEPVRPPASHPLFATHLSMQANRTPLAQWLTVTQRSNAAQLNSTLQTLAQKLPALSYLSPQPGNSVTLPKATSLAKIPTPAVAASKSIEAIIQQANTAMTQDDWSGAYDLWKSLLARPESELNIDLLLRISRELFKLDAFTDAAFALNKAESQTPNHPGLICEQAQQYYYHCYSSWLMLVTENEPDWYKADGLDKRPDWQTACELIEKAENVAPRNNLRRYVQAYLLLAEDAWDNEQREQAHVALLIAIKSIGPNSLDGKLIQTIIEAVDQIRDNNINESDPYNQALQDRLAALPIDFLGVQDWLCLNDILNWNGLLLCGYVAREKAVDRAIALGKGDPKHKEQLKTAFRAALDRGDTVLADDFLAKLKTISPDAVDVRELESCCELMKSNVEAFRQKWPHPPTPAELRLREYLKGKSVAVVGPAPTGSLDGLEIDSFDVVIRMNWRFQAFTESNVAEFGSKTDISLYNAHTIRKIIKDNQIKSLSSLDFILTRRSCYAYSANQNSPMSAFRIHEYPGSIYKSMNAIPTVLFNLILSEASTITLFTTNFYTSTDHHVDGYRGNKKQNVNNCTLVNLRTVLANHDLLAQKNEVKLLWRIGACNLQLETAKVIFLKNEEYFKKIINSMLPNINIEIDEIKLFNDDLQLNKFSKFIYHENLLNNDQLNYVSNKIGNELEKKKLDLSLMNLTDFKRYVKGKTIALVANSAQLLNNSFGEIIDSYDVVIRFNSFKIDERHTGKKTDVHVSVYLQKENLNVFVPIRFIVSNHLGRWVDAIKELSLYSQSFFLKYNHHTSINTSYKDKIPPTSGFVTLTLLLKIGGFKRIDLFGFTFYEGGESSILRNDKGTEEGVSKIHDYNFEKDAVFINAHEYDKKNNIFTFFDQDFSLDGLKC